MTELWKTPAITDAVALGWFFPQTTKFQEFSRTKSENFNAQGLVVQRPINADPVLNFNPGFFCFCSTFCILFRSSNHQIVD